MILEILRIPLILSALNLGIVELGYLKKVGRIGLKMPLYTLIVSSIAVMLGVGVVNLFQPGKDLGEAARHYLTERFIDKSAAITQGTSSAS